MRKQGKDVLDDFLKNGREKEKQGKTIGETTKRAGTEKETKSNQS